VSGSNDFSNLKKTKYCTRQIGQVKTVFVGKMSTYLKKQASTFSWKRPDSHHAS